MTFTWDETDLSTALAQVRMTIGDTVENKALLTDEQIAFRLTQHSQAVIPSSISCIQDILAQIARNVDRSNVGMSATRSQATTHYTDLLKTLRKESALVAEVDVGGISVSAEKAVNSDPDYKQVGMTIGWGRNNG